MYLSRLKKEYLEQPYGKKLATWTPTDISVKGRVGRVDIIFDTDEDSSYNTSYVVSMTKSEAIELIKALYDHLEQDLEKESA